MKHLHVARTLGPKSDNICKIRSRQDNKSYYAKEIFPNFETELTQ